MSQLKGDAAVRHGQIVLNLLLDLVVNKDNNAGTNNYDANWRWQVIGRNRAKRLDDESRRSQQRPASSRPGSKKISFNLDQIKGGLIVHRLEEADQLGYLVTTTRHQGVKTPSPAGTLAAIEECLKDSGPDFCQPLTYDQVRVAFAWLKKIGLLREGDQRYKQDGGHRQFTLDFSGLYQEKKALRINGLQSSDECEIKREDYLAYAMKLREVIFGQLEVKRPKPKPDEPLIELNQWVAANLEEWEKKFLSIYKQWELIYVPLKFETSLPETLPANTQSDYTSPDLPKLIKSALTTANPRMILVEGEAGSGKTCLLIRIAMLVMEQNLLPILLEPPEDNKQDIVEVVRKQLKFVYQDVNSDRVRELFKARRLIMFVDQYSQLTADQKEWCKNQFHPDNLYFFVLSSRIDPSYDFRLWSIQQIRPLRLESKGYTDYFTHLLNLIALGKPNTGAERHAYILSNQLKLIAPTETTVRFAFLVLSLYTSINISTKPDDQLLQLASKILPSIQSWENLADEYVRFAFSSLPQRHESFPSVDLCRLKQLALIVFEQGDKYCSQPFNKGILESVFELQIISIEEVKKVLVNSSLISTLPSLNHYEFSLSCLANLLASLGLIQAMANTQDNFSGFNKFIIARQTSSFQVDPLFLESLRFCCLSLAKEDKRWLENVEILDKYRRTLGFIPLITPDTSDIRHNLINHKKYRKFIGRESHLEELINRLCDPNQPDRKIKIKGVGGAGKTALAIEAALRICKRYHHKYTVIYCQSAKVENRGLIGKHVNDPGDKFTNLDTLISGILSFCYCDYRMFTPEESKSKLTNYLESADNSTLIILDSFESLDTIEQHRIEGFFADLKGDRYKLLLTTREAGFAEINLSGLSRNEAGLMINEITSDDEGNSELLLDEKAKEDIVQAAKFLPLAIVFILGELQRGNSLDAIVKESQNPSGELCEHLFGRSFNDIKKSYPACLRLLYALSFAPDFLKKKTLFQLAKAPLPKEPIATDQNTEDNLIDEEQLQESLSQLDRWSWVVAMERPGITGRWYSFRSSLIRDYVRKDLSKSRYHDTFREAWVNCYVENANEYGNEDFGEWHQQFDNISDELSNYEEVFSWCRDHWWKSDHVYEQAKLLWRTLSRFLYLYPHFQIRDDWSKWIETRAENRDDHDFLPEIYNSNAWLAIMKDGDEDRKTAKLYLDKVECQLNNESNYMYLMYLIIRAVLETRCRAFTRASELFGMANKLCNSLLEQQPRDDQARDSQKHLLRRAKVRIYLYEGEKYYREEDYMRARELFETTFSEAQRINWLRFQIKASERLAYLDLREGKLRDAENRLRQWEPRAENNKDRRRMAFFHRDFAELHLQKEEFDKATERATQARDEFNKQSMNRRVEQMNALLKEIDLCRYNSNLRPI